MALHMAEDDVRLGRAAFLSIAERAAEPSNTEFPQRNRMRRKLENVGRSEVELLYTPKTE